MPRLIKAGGEIRKIMPANNNFFTIEEINYILNDTFSVDFLYKYVFFHATNSITKNLQHNTSATAIIKKIMYGDVLVVEQKYLPAFLFYPYLLRRADGSVIEDFKSMFVEKNLGNKSLEDIDSEELGFFIDSYIKNLNIKYKSTIAFEDFDLTKVEEILNEEVSDEEDFDEDIDDEDMDEEFNEILENEKIELEFELKNKIFKKINYFYLLNIIYYTLFRDDKLTNKEILENFIFLEENGKTYRIQKDLNKLKLLEKIYDFYTKHDDSNLVKTRKILNLILQLKEEIKNVKR